LTETSIFDLVMMAGSMDMDMADLSADAGPGDSGMGHSTVDTAGLELTEPGR
jgi:hypothetical protein